MNVYEYQAKKLLRSYGVAVPPGDVASTPSQAEAVARTLHGPTWMVKAQIHAGGRGPAGGVQAVHTPEDARMVAEHMLGSQLATSQTRPQGQIVHKVYIEQGCEIVRAFYVALLLDSQDDTLTYLASPERGGDSIEEVALRHPERVLKLKLPVDEEPSAAQIGELIQQIGLSGEHGRKVVAYLQTMYRVFLELDATLIEISPLAVVDNGDVLALDVKMSFDDNALYRHADLLALRDEANREPSEAAAAKHGINYVRLQGDIGTLVSGAGLALATLDAIVERGGQPANFMDLPPVSRQAQVAAAFRLLLEDNNIKAILVNVFGGGIMRCDVIADGLIVALREAGNARPKVPLIVRLDGTNAELGRQRLQEAGLGAVLVTDLAEAANQVVVAAQSQSGQRPSSSLLGSMKKLFSREGN
ncbi:MAG: ADP-forming succinate--CoA ligase subunit beta [Gammaproteobacteria bacterium]